jgi:hypothetical protein
MDPSAAINGLLASQRVRLTPKIIVEYYEDSFWRQIIAKKASGDFERRLNGPDYINDTGEPLSLPLSYS